VLAAEHLLRLTGVDFGRQPVERAPEIVGDRLPRLGPFREDRQVLQPRVERVPELEIFLEAAAALQELLGRRLILPEIREGDFFFYLLELVRGACGVKDSSAGQRPVGSDPDTCEAVHPAEMPNPNSSRFATANLMVPVF
jgi:hypothetical protein